MSDGPEGSRVGRLLAEVVRDERRRLLATLVRTTGDWDLAEDAVQDAALAALQTWGRDGVPDNARAWLLVAARRRLIDVARRENVRGDKEAAAARTNQWVASPVSDDELRLVFACCHPSLSVESQVALSLRSLCGLTTEEVARALLVPVETMSKRLTRARQKIRHAVIPYRVPSDADLPGRLGAVCATVYLLFNEGYAAGAGADHLRRDLTQQAVYLARLLARLRPDEARVSGLLALMLLQDARRDSRLDTAGDVVLLADQDRSRWDRAAIREGVELTGKALAATPHRPDQYVVQAAIAACHALAPDWHSTDWAAIVSWYDVLVTVVPTDVVRLNRAVAIGERDGPAAGLLEVEAISTLGGYPLWHASRAELLLRVERPRESVLAFDRALALDSSSATRRHLERRRFAARRSAAEP